MSASRRAFWACLACSLAAAAQSGTQEDLRSVRSPDGNIELQIFVGQPVVEQTSVLPRMAYRVLYKGRPVVDTSFLGFELRAQNPLGEKPGLTSAETGREASYNWLISHFLQNGSQGRMYDLEARAYNTGVAFRYRIPWSAPMANILLEGENTEFQVGAEARSGAQRIADLDINQTFPLPFVIEEPGAVWLAISESGTAASNGKPEPYAPVVLQHDISSIQGPTMVTRLGRLKEKPWLAVESKPTYETPWRVIAIAEARDKLNAPLK